MAENDYSRIFAVKKTSWRESEHLEGISDEESDPGRGRTANLLLRRQALYPVELQGPFGIIA